MAIQEEDIMKAFLLSVCAAAAIAAGASTASAGDIVVRHDDLTGSVIRVDDVRPGYGWNDSGYRYGGYGYQGVVSPRWIVRSLQRQDYHHISRPVLYGRFYQVRAISPYGHYVKLYIDAYSGRIVRVRA